MKHLAVLILGLLLIPSGAQALTFLGGDQQVIDTAIPDDVVASGGSVTVNAPVDSLTVAGGMVTVDAPVAGDVIAAGGTLVINGNVGGKVLAAGGEIELNGNATNALITGGTVTIGENAVIERDAFISAGEVTNAGSVLRNLTVSGATFNNPGTAGNVTFEEPPEPGLLPDLFSVFFAIGFLILGLLLIRGFPDLFAAVVGQVKKNPVLLTVLGFVAIIVSVIILVIVAITVIGLPIALVAGLLFIVALMLSSLFVAYALGDIIASRAGWETGRSWIFVLGFVILQILFFIPLLGAIVQIIAVSLGYGGLLYALRSFCPFRAGGGEA
ncbi:hypothetical protein FGW20_04095 [Methanoculleus sp. FWC-SCC3]|uniref:DUF8173 domain-containing protein n=1 Tax=Methanoculleus methanifontis TaxID=2584086 RepID=A0ABT8M0L9_9EURY|nr:hypothetical protein [Methanoculleus sp. FWC-SCC3]MDN7012233.1 hypothetical protein [Methanoculleus sp. FWC-SCC3]